MKVYDSARLLASSIESSDEFQNYLNAIALKDDDRDLQILLDNFADKQAILQQKHVSGEQLAESEQLAIEEAFRSLSQNVNGRKIIDAEISLERMMNEVYKIISFPLTLR